jgi:hypothetical protein
MDMQIMDFTLVIAQFLSDPNTGYRTGLRFFHFIALAMGLGGATLLDLMLLRFFVRSRISEDTYGVFSFASRVVDVGLKLLWITGLGFLVLYALTKPELLTNPKVHAKLVIVAILTVNGFFIHHVILPSVRNQIGKTLFEGASRSRRAIFVTSGAISAVSWYSPAALGAFPQLNFQVSAMTILLAYLALIVVAACAIHALVYLMHRSALETSSSVTGTVHNVRAPPDQSASYPAAAK